MVRHSFTMLTGTIALAVGIAVSGPASADVRAGVDAWASGDYPAAVAQWRDLAARGDADAQFNMAQAYRLGRGVERDMDRARELYRLASEQGHIKAADNYGLLLFQDGRREAALPFLDAAVERGDPRAQYLLGIAHFNGDLVEKDWVRAYALLTLANAAGLPQAPPALAQMDDFIPLEQRQEAQLLAPRLKRDGDARRSSQLAAADLGAPSMPAAATAPAASPSSTTVRAAEPPRPAPPVTIATIPDAAPVAPSIAAPIPAPAPAPAPVATASTAAMAPPIRRLPQPIPRASVPPSVAAAQAAVAEAMRVTGTTSPARAGADFASGDDRPTVAGVAVATAPEPASVPPPPVSPPAAERTAAPAAGVRPAAPVVASAPNPVPPSPPPTADGPWRVQLGAFGVEGNAERLWTRLSSSAALDGKQRYLVPAGRLTKLQAGGFASRAAANAACAAIKRGGQACIVTR